MRVIPVLDVKAGKAVRAVAGIRANYEPVTSILHEGSDPVSLCRAYRDRLGLHEVYVADLDAIAGDLPSIRLVNDLARPERDPLRTLPAVQTPTAVGSWGNGGLKLWLDAGVRDVPDIRPLLESGASVVVLGVETLRGPSALRRIVCEAPPERLALSLDLRNGVPILDPRADWGTADPRMLAKRAIDLGVRRLILLDLARVGTGMGVGTVPLLAELRQSHPEIELVVGGGVARRDDLEVLARVGATAVLVGSALHDGRIGREDCMEVRARIV